MADPRLRTDVILTVGVIAVLALVVSAGQGADDRPEAYLWAAALGALTARRRAYPRAVLGLTVLGLFAYYAAGFPAIGVAVPVAAALFSAAEAGHRRAAGFAAATVLSVSAGYRIVEGQDFRVVLLYEMAGHLALAAAAIALGELVRARRRIAELTDEQIALAAEHRLDQHKQALSRELHDTIGHTLTVAAIHANVACQEARRDPDAAATALGEVTASVSASLTALRTAVRELRTEAPTRSDVEMVAEQARAAGYTVRTRLDPAAPATAYRVAREGLVNALRHAAGRSIDVEVRRCERNVLVRVRDGGTGLATLRAEVAGLGGRFDAGPAGDGWQVTATVPAGERGRRG